jgi:hypothetical protein
LLDCFTIGVIPRKPHREAFSDAIHQPGRAENEPISNGLSGAKEPKGTGGSNPLRSGNVGAANRCRGFRPSTSAVVSLIDTMRWSSSDTSPRASSSIRLDSGFG